MIYNQVIQPSHEKVRPPLLYEYTNSCDENKTKENYLIHRLCELLLRSISYFLFKVGFW